jgi:hypothetical protein
VGVSYVLILKHGCGCVAYNQLGVIGMTLSCLVSCLAFLTFFVAVSVSVILIALVDILAAFQYVIQSECFIEYVCRQSLYITLTLSTFIFVDKKVWP